ncbi:uncharacterized protein LOC134244994, partial [Saccostrea cucullata]|uniref:uncharacterized protein LOC134244994 n=1 Tax=Saccostrea cuccullata TaxID=36930 RepID=UPI002ED0149D
LPTIMRSIFDLQIADEMPCFDPKGVIFITNKWDALQGTHEDGEEDIRTRTWRHVKKGISDDVGTFKEIQETLDNVIKENENIRVKHHFNFLQKLLDDIKIDIRARLKSVFLTEEEQTLSLEETQLKVEKLKGDIVKRRKQFGDRLDELITKIADEIVQFAKNGEGMNAILNPPRHIPIIDSPYPEKMEETVQSRVDMYVNQNVRSPEVREKFDLIMADIKNVYEEMLSELSEMERKWTHLDKQQEEEFFEEETVVKYAMWIPVVVIGLVLAFQSGIGIDIAPLTGPFKLFHKKSDEKYSLIEIMYKDYIETLHEYICKELTNVYGYNIKKSIEKITGDIVPKRIEKLQDVIQALSLNRQHIIENQEHLKRLSTKLALINKERDDICEAVNSLTKDNL